LWHPFDENTMASVTIGYAAQKELDDAYVYFLNSSQRAADEFLDDVRETFRKIGYQPDFWPVDDEDDHYRFCLLNRYSYLVIFRIEGDGSAQVVAVMHTPRHPGS